MIRVEAGDCIEVMRSIEAGSIDAVVTDPPYGLEFMGKDWDKLDAGLPQEAVWKGRRGRGGSNIGDDDATPGSRHRVSLGGGRSGFKRCAICGKRAFSGSPCQCPEPQWVVEYPEGPPSGAVRMQRWHEQWAREALRVLRPGGYLLAFGAPRTYHRLACAIEEAGFTVQDCIMWLFGTGYPKGREHLKPAYEPIVVAYKPGGARTLQIDECRVGAEITVTHRRGGSGANGVYGRDDRIFDRENPVGRWPANICHDGSAEVLAGFPQAKAGGNITTNRRTTKTNGIYGAFPGENDRWLSHGDDGSAARFFYTAKAGAEDRWGSRHPTVKPVDLMRWLVPLVSPPGGLVLDPFAGSGTTGVAALATGRSAILIEREAEYLDDIRERLAHYAGDGRHSLAAKGRKSAPRGTAPLFDDR